MVRPEIQAEIAAVKVAFVNLRAAILTLPQVDTTRKLRMTNAVANAEGLRRLDRLYTCYSGCALNKRNAPVYSGPLYEWRSSRGAVTSSVIACLIRLRRSEVVGAHSTTHFLALNYFASIWPDPLPWPSDIPRPTEANQRDAA